MTSAGTSNFVIRWINVLTMLLALAVIGFGVWLNTHHDSCRKTLTLPVLGLGGFILLVSLIGFMGAYKNISILLWIVSFSNDSQVSGIEVSRAVMPDLDCDSGLHSVGCKFIILDMMSSPVAHHLCRYKEYQLRDYSSWFRKQLNNTENWKHLKSCLVKSEDCNNLPKKYKTLKQYKKGNLTPVEAGCCRPPSECGYPAINASYYDLSFRPVSTNNDCKLYRNSRAIKCYNCDSCKAGVAQYMKTEWRVVAIFNVALFVVLSFIYFVGCCARKNATRDHSSKVRR
ncbi:hypothetical protein IFM89_002478 [Coptis chinensis]|uniref:Tetraspanin-10 n=1 Tax=Coptis chinensis TaxID=261450 RepID=A0A835HG57_9MAGN|nr:hypothetical protein IFM89_002478 [Coptis chinensis]